MNKIIANHRFRLLAIFVFLFVALMVVMGVFFVNITITTLEESTREKMQDESAGYVERLNDQIQSDYALLNSLSPAFKDASGVSKKYMESFLLETFEKNDFISMLYFSMDGNGIIKTAKQDFIQEINLSSCDEEAIRVVQSAFSGKQGISNIFEGKYSNEKVFFYGVPVYDGSNVVGALCATSTLKVFQETLEQEIQFHENSIAHLLDSNGNYIVRGSNSLIRKDVDSIFDPAYGGTSQRKETLRKRMNDQEEVFVSFEYDSVSYRMYLSPVGVNGWYLCTINNVQDLNVFIYRIVMLLIAFFLLMIILFFVVLVLGYFMIVQQNKELYKFAFYDSLTGAYNFIYFQSNVQEALKKDGNGTIVSLNVRQFKFFNELFGREQGNNFLCHIHSILASSLEPEEIYCRESADAFYLYLKDIDRNRIQVRLEKILQKIDRFPLLSEGQYRVNVCCGVVISDVSKSYYTYDQMMTHVMFALANAKDTIQDKIWFFDEELHKKEILNNTIEGNMSQALLNNEFQLYLQPKIDLKTDTISSAEALVRWVRSDGSMLSPADFIPLFESNGFCAKLDLYMLEKACKQLYTWKQNGIDLIPISVNQSKLAFYSVNYLERVRELLETYQVDPSLITLEVLEGMAIDDLLGFNALLNQLQGIGLRIALDDFGSGYSSLNVLSRLDIDEIKIDRSFINELILNPDSKGYYLLEEIIALSKKLNLDIVVEGVETLEQEQLIKKLHCDFGQGYLYDAPLAIEAFTDKYLKRKGVL